MVFKEPLGKKISIAGIWSSYSKRKQLKIIQRPKWSKNLLFGSDAMILIIENFRIADYRPT